MGTSYWDCSFIATSKPDYRLTTSNISKRNSIKTILTKYFKILTANYQIDFEQILYYSLKLLKSKSIITTILSKIFPYILIDEYQDTKEIQYHIICSILNASKQKTKLFIVGDPNQSIYQTLGGYPIDKPDLQELCGLKIKELKLTKNYRSSKKVIEYFNYFKTIDNEITANGKNAEYESIISLNNTVKKDDLIDEIGRIININIKVLGIPQNEICVLAPQWVHIASATRKLMLTLPDYSFDGPGMAPFSRDIENFWFRLSRIVLTEPSPNLYIRRLRWSSDIINELNNAGVDISQINKKRLLKMCNSIKIHETDGLKYLELFFCEICERLGIIISDFPTLHENFDSFFESSNNRIERLLREGIDYIDNIDTFKKVFQQREGITVSTYHGVKGTEFDTVIAFALLQDYIPHFSDPNGTLNSKKLLYVIASRARKNIYLIAERERYKNFGSPPPSYEMTRHLREYNYEYDDR